MVFRLGLQFRGFKFSARTPHKPFGCEEVYEVDDEGQGSKAGSSEERCMGTKLLGQRVGGTGGNEGCALTSDKTERERDSEAMGLEEPHDNGLLDDCKGTDTKSEDEHSEGHQAHAAREVPDKQT